MHESLPLLARDGLIAEHAEGLEFGCELCFAIHLDGAEEFLSLKDKILLRAKNIASRATLSLFQMWLDRRGFFSG